MAVYTEAKSSTSLRHARLSPNLREACQSARHPVVLHERSTEVDQTIRLSMLFTHTSAKLLCKAHGLNGVLCAANSSRYLYYTRGSTGCLSEEARVVELI